jgi:hypothetical protein
VAIVDGIKGSAKYSDPHDSSVTWPAI